MNAAGEACIAFIKLPVMGDGGFELSACLGQEIGVDLAWLAT